MAKRVTVLGAGRVGRAMALDLAKDGEFEVRVADASAAALGSLAGAAHVETMKADLADAREVRRALADADYAIGAVPGFMGYRTLETIIQAGVDVVDITFFEQDALRLDALAKEKGVCAIVDAGVAPGLTNVLAGHHAATWDRLDRFVCGVGGLPVVRTLPWEYKAAFSPVDVLEIYTRPARVIEGGKVVAKPALAELAPYEFPGVGTVDAFVTDGLRTLLTTIPCREMRELTLRYPGHAEKMRTLRDAGFLSAEPIEIAGVAGRADRAHRPPALPALADRPGRGGPDALLLRGGRREGRRSPSRRAGSMLDRYDRVNGVSSMARTTGYTATAALRLLAAGTFRPTGIVPPECDRPRREGLRLPARPARPPRNPAGTGRLIRRPLRLWVALKGDSDALAPCAAALRKFARRRESCARAGCGWCGCRRRARGRGPGPRRCG